MPSTVYSGPSGSFQYGWEDSTPLAPEARGGFGGVPSFTDILGTSPQDLLGFLNELKMRNAQQAHGFQSSLLGQQIAGQTGIARLQADLERELGLGDQSLRRELGLGQLDLGGRQLGETGRQFDISAADARAQNEWQRRYQDALLQDQLMQSQFGRDQVRFLPLRERLSAIPTGGGRTNRVQAFRNPNSQFIDLNINTASAGSPRFPGDFIGSLSGGTLSDVGRRRR